MRQGCCTIQRVLHKEAWSISLEGKNGMVANEASCDKEEQIQVPSGIEKYSVFLMNRMKNWKQVSGHAI
jgi:hypothetical protein